MNETMGMGSCEKAKRESQIASAFGRLLNAADRIEKNIEIHSERIGPVLSPNLPDCVGGRLAEPVEQKAPLAVAIDALANRLDATAGRLGFMTQRVEL